MSTITSAGPRASWLFVPGHDRDKLTKALTRRHVSGEAVVIVDLEDAVPEACVPRAHEELQLAAAHQVPFVCRIRGDGDVAFDDLAHLPDVCWGVVLPKAEDCDLIEEIGAAMAASGKDRRLWLLIETPAGVDDLERLLAVRTPVEGVMLGSGDLRALTGASSTDDEIELLYPRSRLVYAGRRFGLVDIIDGPDPDFRDLDAVARRSRTARALGMTGKAAIHPAQLESVARAFAPTDAEVAHARAILAAPDGASASGGTLVDAATKLQARALLDRVPTANRTGD